MTSPSYLPHSPTFATTPINGKPSCIKKTNLADLLTNRGAVARFVVSDLKPEENMNCI
jgi:hypothetical protein